MHSVLSLAALASVATAALHQIPQAPAVASSSADGTTGVGYFQQLIDHDHPELGTFSQRYFWSDAFWKGPGSPVGLYNPFGKSQDRQLI